MYMEFYQNIKKDSSEWVNVQFATKYKKVAYSKNQNCIGLKCTSQKSNCKEFILE